MLTVAGVAPSLDVTYVVDRLTPGTVHRPVETARCAGGKPLNLARAAAAVGADVAVVAVLGGPTGRTVHEALLAERVPVRVVATPEETRTCVSVAALDAEDLTEVYEYARPVPPEVWAALVAALAAALGDRPGWLAVSGGAPRSLPGDALAGLVRLAHGAGRRVAVDTHGAALPAAVDARPDLVKVNRAEAAELLGAPPGTDLARLARAVASRSGGPVVLTDAHHGALAVEGGGPGDAAHAAALPGVRGRFGVGSGDAFAAGLLTELDRGAANALLPGPGRLSAATVADLRDRVVLTPA